MDQRNLIHPMTAGDLVQSAVIVAQAGQSHDSDETRVAGAQLRLLEVVDVEYEATPSTHAAGSRLIIEVRDRDTGEQFQLKLHPDTPILVTDISL